MFEQKARELLAKMTLDEKCTQVLAYYPWRFGLDPAVEYSVDNLPEKIADLLRRGLGNLNAAARGLDAGAQARTINALQKYIVTNSRLHIPLMIHYESLHGNGSPGGTVFPQAIGLASAWDPKLMREVFSVVAKELRSRGVHITYAPVLDIGTDPRWGRFQETYGEEPFLTGELAVGVVKGYQGEKSETIDGEHVASTVKHFAGYAQGESGRNFAPARITYRELHDRTLVPFRRAVQDAGVWGVMPAHHEIDGVPCHNNPYLLDEVLHKQWGFRGILISDAEDIHRLHVLHRVAETDDDATEFGLRNRIAVDILTSFSYQQLPALLGRRPHLVPFVERIVLDILTLKFRLGLFENPYVKVDHAVEISLDKSHRAVAKKAADLSIVLIKNENALLPLDASKLKTLAVIGPNAADIQCGTYGPNRGVSILEGLQAKLAGKVKVVHEIGCYITRNTAKDYLGEEMAAQDEDAPRLVTDEQNAPLIAKAVQAALTSDAVVLCVGGNNYTAREAFYKTGHRGDRDEVRLAGSQEKLIREVAATGKPVILILNHGQPAAIEEPLRLAGAALEIWFAGQETGRSVADILFGDVNPSGKLPCSFPRSVGQIPAYYSQKPSAYLKEYLFVENGPVLPFGFGLSYTSFSYANLSVSPASMPPDGSATVSVDVTNTGQRTGDEVVQMYVRDDFSSVARSVMELRGFERITLKPGETRTVRFPLTSAHLGFTNVDFRYTVEKGTFTIMAGANSRDVLKTTLKVE